MKAGIVAGMVFLLAANGQAATEFRDNVPVNVAKALLSPGNGADVGLYTDIPDDFPAFELPEEFAVMGSIDQGFSQRVILTTRMNREAASAAVINAFTEAGWVELVQPDTAVTQPRGFVPSGVREAEALMQTLCHDDLGNMSMSVQVGEDGTLVNLRHYNNQLFGGRQPNCEQQAQQMFQGPGIRGAIGMGVMQYLPTLEMPEQSGPGAGPGVRGIMDGGGSSNDYESRSGIRIDWDIGDLYEFFAAQIIDQGWTLDADWTGKLSAGGNWTKSPEEDMNLLVSLSIVESADNNFEMKLRILSLSSKQGSPGLGIRGINIIRQ